MRLAVRTSFHSSSDQSTVSCLYSLLWSWLSVTFILVKKPCPENLNRINKCMHFIIYLQKFRYYMFKVVSFSCIFILYEFKSMPSQGNRVILIGLFSLLVIVMSCRKHQMYYFDEAQLHDYSNSRSIVINCTLTKGQNIVWNCCISLLKTVVLTHQSEMSIPRFYFKMRCKNLPIWRRLQIWFLHCQSIWGPDIKNTYFFLQINFYLPQEVHVYEQSACWRNTGFDIC